MRAPTPNLSHFHAHPPTRCDDDGKPLTEPKLRYSSIKANVVNHPAHQRAQRAPMRDDQAANDRRAARAGRLELDWMDPPPPIDTPHRGRKRGDERAAIVRELRRNPGRSARVEVAVNYTRAKKCVEAFRALGCEATRRQRADGLFDCFARYTGAAQPCR